MSNEFKIMMFGPRGVGKTSLLTAMYNDFNTLISRTAPGIQLLPNPETKVKLENKLKQLKKPLEDSEKLNLTSEDGITGTKNIESYIFNLSKQGKEPFITLKFIDFEGGYISEYATPEKVEQVQKLINYSDSILLAIDTPAMIEPDKKDKLGIYMEDINKSSMVTNFLRNMLVETPKLILLCPLKSEKYLQDSKRRDDYINEKVTKAFHELISSFKTKDLEDKVCLAITPVQTIGNVVFSRIQDIIEEDGSKYPEFVYVKSQFTDQYLPKDCDQPLRYIFSFLFTLYLKNRSWSWLRDLFGRDDHIKNAILSFAKDRKETDPFEIKQGRNLLYHE